MYFSIAAFVVTLFAWRRNPMTFDQVNEVRMREEREKGLDGEGGWESNARSSSRSAVSSDDVTAQEGERVVVDLETGEPESRREPFLDVGALLGKAAANGNVAASSGRMTMDFEIRTTDLPPSGNAPEFQETSLQMTTSRGQALLWNDSAVTMEREKRVDTHRQRARNPICLVSSACI
jgi:hypothetical protein